MKSRMIFGTLILVLGFGLSASFSFSKEISPTSPIAPYYGKSYGNTQDPEYLSYDQTLREHLVKRIHQKFGVVLDPKRYSSFDLLEIEALFKCKKSSESYESFLKIFPKR